MRYLPQLSLSVWATLALLVGGALACLSPAWSADQKPLVINPTTGKQEQLQAGNRLALPDASGDLVTIGPGVQTANRVISYPVLSADDTLAALGVVNVFTLSQYVQRATTADVGWAVVTTGDTQDRWRVRAGGEMDWGSGSIATDVALSRTAVGRMLLNAQESSTTPLTGGLVVGDGSTTASNVGIGGGNITAGANITATGILTFAGSTNTLENATAPATNNAGVHIYRTFGGGSGDFAQAGHLILQPRTSTGVGRDVIVYAGDTTPTERFRFSSTNVNTSTGQLVVSNATEASAVNNASIYTAGGLGVAKRSYLGTINTGFKGNVIAGVGDATADTAGAVGEVLSGSAASTAVASTGTVGNVCSVSLTPGAWMITGSFTINQGTTGLTTGSVVNCSIVTTTATNGTQGTTMNQDSALLAANGFKMMSAPTVTVNISATTTYYLTEQCAYTGGSPTVSGKITAVRIR